MTLKATGEGISPDTKIRFSLVQLCIICSALIGGTVTVLSFVEQVRRDVESARTQLGAMTQRLDALERTMKEYADQQRAQETAAAKRWENWRAWRWKTTADVMQLGKAGSVQVWLREGDGDAQ